MLGRAGTVELAGPQLRMSLRGSPFAPRPRKPRFLERIATMTTRFAFHCCCVLGRREQRARPRRALQLRQDGQLRGVQDLQVGHHQGATQLSDLADRQVKAAVDAELATKGLPSTEADTADLYIGYQAAVGQEKEYTSFDSGWGYGPGWYGGGWYGGGGGGMTTGTTSTIYIGQLALDMYASSPHTLVWRGVASKTLDTEAKPEKQEKNLAKAVAKLLRTTAEVKT